MFCPTKSMKLYKDLKVNIVQVGAGGNGGYLCQKVARMIASLRGDKEINYTIIDLDVVEKHNLKRQPFIYEDIGLNKAQVLAERYSSAYGISIFSMDKYIHFAEDLEPFYEKDQFNIFIGAVDNNASRQVLHEFFMSVDDIYYIDGGIDEVSGETEEEKFESGYTGQVVGGLRLNGETILDPVGIVYSNILEDKTSSLPGTACGLTVVNHPQRMQTNEYAALIMQSYLQNVLYENTIISHYTNFNALTMSARPVFLDEK